MTPDTNDAHDDRSTGTKTFRPPVDDYFRKTVRDDHAPNAALHAAVKAAAEDDDRIHSVNLMGSHAPGNSHKGEPRYNVRVDVRNEGMGHPVLGATVVGRLVERGDVRITDVVECSDDHLVVALRPIETRVEPVEVPYRFIPDEYTSIDTLRRDAATTLRTAIDDHGVNDTTRIAAKTLATVLCVNAPDSDYDDVEPDAAPTKEYHDLLDRTDVDFENETRMRRFDDTVYRAITYGDGKTLEVPDFESSHEAVDAAKAIVREFAQNYHAGDLAQSFVQEKADWGTAVTDVFESFDMRRYTIDVFNRAYARHRDDSGDVTSFPPTIDHDVDDRFARVRVTVDGDDYTDVVREKERMPNLPDGVDVYVDSVEAVDGTRIPCGCGDYAIEVPERSNPPKIDVVCPACGNHFGHGVEPTEPCPCNHDHDEPRSLAEATASGLGLAAVAELVAREDDGGGVDRTDLDVDDEAIGKALAKGVVSFTDGGRLVDTRDVVRDGLADGEGGSE